MTYTHAIVDADYRLVELVNLADGMTISLNIVTDDDGNVIETPTAIAKTVMDGLLTTHGDLNAVCAHFGWTNVTGVNLTNE